MLFLHNGASYCHEICLADNIRSTLQYKKEKLPFEDWFPYEEETKRDKALALSVVPPPMTDW